MVSDLPSDVNRYFNSRLFFVFRHLRQLGWNPRFLKLDIIELSEKKTAHSSRRLLASAIVVLSLVNMWPSYEPSKIEILLNRKLSNFTSSYIKKSVSLNDLTSSQAWFEIETDPVPNRMTYSFSILIEYLWRVASREWSKFTFTEKSPKDKPCLCPWLTPEMAKRRYKQAYLKTNQTIGPRTWKTSRQFGH